MGQRVVAGVCWLLFVLPAAACGGDDDGGGGGGGDGGQGHVTEVPGLVPDDVAVALPDAVQASRRCTGTSAWGQVEEMVRHVEKTQGHVLAQFRVVDLMAGEAEASGSDDTYSEAGAFVIEITDELAAAIAADVADYPELADDSPPGGFVFDSPRFCYRKNLAGEFSHAFYLDRYGFAEGAGCDDLDRYMTRFEWNDDRTRFRVRINRYRGFWPVPHFNYYYDETNPVPAGAGDYIDGYDTYTYDLTTQREEYRLATLGSWIEPHDVLDGTYELTGTMQQCGADECLAYNLAVNFIGDLYDRVEIYAGKGDNGGVVSRSLMAQRDGGGEPASFWGDWQSIVDGGGCVLWERARGLDGYGAWDGAGTGDPTAVPFYDDVITTGVDFNSAAIDFSGLTGLPDSADDLPLLFVVTPGGADPADPNAPTGVGFAIYAFDQLFTPYLYWGGAGEVPGAEVYQDDWDASAHALTFSRVPGSLALAP